jgi:hypothetical protein
MSDIQSTRRSTAFACLAALLMLAQLLAGKAIRDALFLTYFDATDLPAAIIGAGVISLLSAVPAARGLARFGPARAVPWLFAVSAGLFIAEWSLVERAPKVTAVILYLHLAAAAAVLISGFWSTVNERFDPHSAKRSLARIASFATFGGLIGGVLSERTSAAFGLHATLLLMAAMHGLCALFVAGIGAPRERPTDIDAPVVERSGLQIISGSSYLKLMLALTFSLAVMDAMVDYAFKSRADAVLDSGEELVRFFAYFYTGIGLVTFLVQSLLARRLLGRFGIGAAMASLPLAIGATGLFALTSARIWSAAAMRASGSVLANSLYRTGFELLYTPLPKWTKRPTKLYVDVGGQRIGDIVGGGLVMALLALGPMLGEDAVIVAALVMAGFVLALLVRLQAAYAGQLASNLQSGEISLEGMDPLAQSVARSHMGLDRSEILARIHEVRAGSSPASPLTAHHELASDDLIAALADPDRVAAASARLVGEGAFALPTLLAALADPDTPTRARLLIPGLVLQSGSAAEVAGLSAGLQDARFEVRFRCARAMARLGDGHPEARATLETVLDALRFELAPDSGGRGSEASLVGDDRSESILLADYPDLEIGRRLEHVFTVLALHFDPQLMSLLLVALHSSDEVSRGTALEYLEVTLPEDVRRGIDPLIGTTPRRRAPVRRGAAQLEAELLGRTQSSDRTKGD